MTATSIRQNVFNILILDDNPSTRNLASITLEANLPCATQRCQSVEEFLGLAAETSPDLVLLDVDLGEDSGIEVCQALKANDATEAIPIVFLSSHNDPAKRVEALKSGGVDYLNKPFYPEELVTRVKIHIEMHRLRLDNASQIAEQRALLRVLCHDLVNPIFGAHGLLSLRQETGKPVDNATIGLAIGCCQSALDIIEHVRVEHSSLKANKNLPTESVLIRDAFEESKRILSERFSKKEIELVTQADDGLSIRINRIELVHNILNNLLTNALKFSYPQSKVQLKAYTVQERNRNYCAIEVRDNGAGMPPEILDRVFSETANISRPGTAAEAGTGFGMPLVKRYVENNGGEISVASTEEKAAATPADRGTTIRILFPLSA